jgi:hypothetical protein
MVAVLELIYGPTAAIDLLADTRPHLSHAPNMRLIPARD